MRNTLLFAAFFIITALPGVAGASADGGGSTGVGGGGAQIESAFRVRARELISQVEATPPANVLCDSTLLQSALDHTDIRVVDRLINPATRRPISDRDLDAWTVPGTAASPGDMQLLKASWDLFFNHADQSVSIQSVNVLILHEVYRATGACDDERFVISDRIPALLAKYADQPLLPAGSAWAKMSVLPGNYGGNPLITPLATGAASVAYYTASLDSQGNPTITGAKQAPFMDPDPTYPYAPVVLAKNQSNDAGLGGALSFTIFSNATVSPPAGQTAALIVRVDGNGSSSSSQFLAPVAGVNGSPCGSAGCMGISGIFTPIGGHFYSVPFLQGMTVQIYPNDICADYAAQSSGQQAFGCVSPAPSSGPVVQVADPLHGVSGAPLQLTWQIVYIDTYGTIQGAPADQVRLDLQFQGSAQDWICPGDLSSLYYPGNGSITLNASGFLFATGSNFTPQIQLITVAQLEPKSPVMDATFADASINTLLNRGGMTGAEIIDGLVNSGSNSRPSYELGFMVRDAGGLINPVPFPQSRGYCTLSGVRAGK